MKILDAQQIKLVDEQTIQRTPISSIDLMEIAAEAIFQCLERSFNFQDTKIKLVCGQGNNGGDGLALARLLHQKGYEIQVFLLKLSDRYSIDNQINQKRLKTVGVPINIVQSEEDLPSFSADDILIDAIFGSGFKTPVSNELRSIFNKINQQQLTKIAIDIPSGLESNGLILNNQSAIKCQKTIGIELPKLCYFFKENQSFVGEWKLVPIGLNQKAISNQNSSQFLIDDDLIQSIYQPRNQFSYKGTHGHALLVGGSKGMMGAAQIMTFACLRGGAGKTTCHTVSSGVAILQTTIPEAMVQADSNDDFITNFELNDSINALAIGPGFGQNESSYHAIRKCLNQNIPKVIDADALNILSKNLEWLNELKGDTILTPHLGEFKRLVGDFENSIEVMQKQIEFSKKHKVYIVLKGTYTQTSTPQGEVYFNHSGNPGLAKGGSGDALTGLITALLAQKYSPRNAAILGVYLHGKAADFALKKQSEESLITRDVIEHFGDVFKYIRSLS